MRKVFILIVFKSLFSCKSSKVVTEEKNNLKEIEISEKSRIVSDEGFNKSLNSFAEDMITNVFNSVKKEMKDSVDIKMMIETGKPAFITLLKSKFQKFKNYNFKVYKETFVLTEKVNGKIVGDYKVYNTKNDTVRLLAKKDSITFYHKYKEDNSEVIFDLVENRKDRRKINGFDCFKINYKLKIKDDFLESDFSKFVKDKYKNVELFVTEKIKFGLHPLVKSKLILDKYYPIQAKVSESYVKGAYQEYLVEKVN